MAKNIRRMLAMVLVLCMFASALPMQALAAEEDTTIETVTEDGVTTEITATTTTSTDSTGNVTVTVDIQQTTSGTSTSTGAVVEGSASSTSTTVQDSAENVITHSSSGESTLTSTTTDTAANTTTEVKTDAVTESEQKETGETRDYQETTTTTTTTDANGNVISEKTVVDGSETKEWTEELPETAEDLPEVEVTVKPGENNTSDNSSTTTDTIGDKATGNYTETTTTINREVSAELSEPEIQIEESSIDLDSIMSEDYEGKNGIKGGESYWDYWEDNGVLDVAKPDTPGFDYQYTGLNEIALNPYRTNVWTVTYETDEDGNPVRDENGNLIIKEKIAVNPSGNHSAGHDKLGYPTQTKTFILTKYGENGEKERFLAYCVDNDTSAEDRTWYTVANLEDSNYYPDEESADHLRAIALNGYWGTEEGTGSVAQIKESLLTAYDADDEITVKDTKTGKEHTYKVVDIIGNLCEGEALNVTQAAIWSYSNGALDVQSGKNSIIVNDNFSYAADGHPESLARMRIMYEWLMGLEQEKSAEDSTVINEQNFVEEVSLIVGDKVGEVTVLSDDTSAPAKTNGVYETDLNFSLAFVPTENDDLLVCLKYVDLDGNEQTVTKRLAGNAAEGETYGKLNPNDDGSYTFAGLKLGENQEFDFDLNLQGTQYLKEGVYIYTAHGGVSESQTMVGIAEGTQSVNITASMSLSFSVDEEQVVHVERNWYNEVDPSTSTPGGDDPTPTVFRREGRGEAAPDPQPQIFRLNNQDEALEEIPEEPVPLATPVVTGDDSNMWIAVILMSVLCMAAIHVFDKKRQHEAF